MRSGDRAPGVQCVQPGHVGRNTETKQPPLLLVKVTLGPLIWAIKGTMNPAPRTPRPPAASEVPGWKTLDTVFPI